MKLEAKSVYDTLETIEALLKTSKRAFYTRFGDGEIYIMAGRGIHDHTSSKDLTDAVLDAWNIRNPQYLRGASVNFPKEKGMIKGVLAPFPQQKELEQILLEQGVEEGTVFENPVVFHYLALFDPDRMNSFLDEYVRPKKKMFIGSADPKIIEFIFGKIDVYVPTPPVEAFNKIEEWFPAVEKNIGKVDVVLPAAGASTKILQRRLWDLEVPVHSLDIGSIVDAVQLKGSRRWIRLLGHRSQKILLPGWRESGLFEEKPMRRVVQELKYNFHYLLGK